MNLEKLLRAFGVTPEALQSAVAPTMRQVEIAYQNLVARLDAVLDGQRQIIERLDAIETSKAVTDKPAEPCPTVRALNGHSHEH